MLPQKYIHTRSGFSKTTTIHFNVFVQLVQLMLHHYLLENKLIDQAVFAVNNTIQYKYVVKHTICDYINCGTYLNETDIKFHMLSA